MKVKKYLKVCDLRWENARFTVGRGWWCSFIYYSIADYLALNSLISLTALRSSFTHFSSRRATGNASRYTLGIANKPEAA
jgi:hypothetical protein